MRNLFKISNLAKTFVLALLLISVVSTSNAFASSTSISKLSIKSIADISTTINQGNKYPLPTTVTAKMSDGSNKNVTVVWNSKVVDTNKVGTVTYTGTVSGYSKKVKLTLKVKALPVTIKSIADISTTINQGNKYPLPTTVTAKMSDGSSKNVTVTWNSKTVNTAKIGTITYTGTVGGYSKKIKLTLTVVQSNTIVTSSEDLVSCLKSNTPFVITDDKLKCVYVKAQQILKNIIKPNMDDFEKEKAIHDYICINTEYGNSNEDHHNVYGALINHEAVCSGYADATYLLLNMAGIECNVLTSNEMDHMWNIVKINGKYFHLDVTWDDRDTGDDKPMVYDCFNVTDNKIASDHVWHKSLYPVCNTTCIENLEFENLNISTYEGCKFNLQNTITALMIDNSYQEVAVNWNTTNVNINKVGTYTFEGTVDGYIKKIKGILTVQNNTRVS